MFGVHPSVASMVQEQYEYNNHFTLCTRMLQWNSNGIAEKFQFYDDVSHTCIDARHLVSYISHIANLNVYYLPCQSNR